MSPIKTAQAAYQTFVDQYQSAMLSTISADGIPNASYAPFVRDDDRNFYIYVSGLATHTQNLASNPKVSILLIEDEANTQQIFARTRLSFECTAKELERESALWMNMVDRFADRFGEIIENFRGLADFRIFQLTPYEGRFVMGFGAIYPIQGDNLDRLVPLKK
jgi:putative heme iron utilization protein